MVVTTAEKKEALAAALEQELGSLQGRGVRVAGNAFSPIVLVKGELNAEELAGGALLAGADGDALRSALPAIGWQPQDFCALASVMSANARGPMSHAGSASSSGGATLEGEEGDEADTPGFSLGAPLTPELFREALEALDPEAVVLLDNTAADVMREAYADALAIIEDFNTAMLKPGLVAPVLGRRVLALDGFEAALADPSEKQRMWAYLKQLTPLGAPY